MGGEGERRIICATPLATPLMSSVAFDDTFCVSQSAFTTSTSSSSPFLFHLPYLPLSFLSVVSPSSLLFLLLFPPVPPLADYTKEAHIHSQNMQECLRLILEWNGDVASQDAQGMQPLHWALQFPSEGRREGGREGGRKEGRKEGMGEEGGREGEREGRVRRKERGMDGGREEGSE